MRSCSSCRSNSEDKPKGSRTQSVGVPLSPLALLRQLEQGEGSGFFLS